MIIRPSSRQLLQTVQTALRDTIAPKLADDPDAATALGMIDSILGIAIRRADDEPAWLREEITEIKQLARHLIDEGLATDELKDALAALNATPDDDQLTELHQRYTAAGDVLSAALEAGMRADGSARAHAEGVLERRLAREITVRGDFALAGRV